MILLKFKISAFVITMTLFTGGSIMASTEIDMIYTHGKVYTVDSSHPRAEAFAIKDGRFYAVGSTADMLKLKTKNTKIVDMQGEFVMPGMVEDHIHPDMAAENIMNINIPDPNMTYEKFGAEITQFLKDHPKTKWIFGGPMNWLKDHEGNIDVWNIPSNHKVLDKWVNDRPAFFWDLGGHAAVINEFAMKKYGIKKRNKPPKGGSWDYDKDGNPTGIIREVAANMIWEEFLKERPSPQEQAKRGFIPVFHELNSYGFTSITDIWARPWNIENYQALEKMDRLTTRVTIYVTDPIDWHGKWIKKLTQDLIDKGPHKYSDKINLIGIKFVLDGSAGGQTAVMKEPFIGTKNRGFWRNDPKYYKKKVLEYDKMGYVVRAHAVGDRAISTVIDAIEQTRKNGSKLRHGIAHTVFVDPADYDRIKKNDVLCDMSPYFWMPDPAIETIKADVGEKRLQWIFPFRPLLDRGVHLSAGSDLTVSPINPWKPMEGMVTRQLPGGVGKPINAKDMAITIEEAIYIYTMGGAYSEQKENEIGSITPGKFADFIVLDQDLIEIKPTEIHKTKVLSTFLGGRQVYRSGEDVPHIIYKERKNAPFMGSPTHQ